MNIASILKEFDLLWGIAPPDSLKGLKGDEVKSFLQEKLEALLGEMQEEIEEIIVPAEGLAKFSIGSVELHTTIGGNAGSRRAAAIIESKR